MRRRQTRSRRGMTLIEVMVAAAVMVLGLVGVMQLLIVGAQNERRGEQNMSQALLVGEATEDSIGLAYDNLTPGTTTNASLKDSSGRSYTRTVTVTQSPPAAPHPFYTVTVQVVRPGGIAAAATYQTVTVVSKPPPAGGSL